MVFEITRLENNQLQRIEKAFDNVAKAIDKARETQEQTSRTMLKILDEMRKEKDGPAGQDS